MKTKNLVLTAMSLSLLLACKKQETITTEVDYKKKLQQEFNLTSISSSTKMANKENKPVHTFATYEEQYKYLKELVKNTVIYDTSKPISKQIFPALGPFHHSIFIFDRTCL